MMYSIQVDIDVPAAARSVELSHAARHDQGMLLKTVLTQVFSGPLVRPWRLHKQSGAVATVLGYSDISATDLRARAALAMPAVRAAVLAVHGHALPELQAGQRFRFITRICPTIRITPAPGRRHGERDAYLAAIDKGESWVTREAVYLRYLAERLQGAEIEASQLTGFRLVEAVRPNRGILSGLDIASHVARKTMPVADVIGSLTVTDAVALMATMHTGIGRGRAYGHGYVRLEPERMGGGEFVSCKRNQQVAMGSLSPARRGSPVLDRHCEERATSLPCTQGFTRTRRREGTDDGVSPLHAGVHPRGRIG